MWKAFVQGEVNARSGVCVLRELYVSYEPIACVMWSFVAQLRQWGSGGASLQAEKVEL